MTAKRRMECSGRGGVTNPCSIRCYLAARKRQNWSVKAYKKTRIYRSAGSKNNSVLNDLDRFVPRDDETGKSQRRIVILCLT